eukprot:9143449-Alexandrium_andersonii.AAC.1
MLPLAARSPTFPAVASEAPSRLSAGARSLRGVLLHLRLFAPPQLPRVRRGSAPLKQQLAGVLALAARSPRARWSSRAPASSGQPAQGPLEGLHAARH